MKTVRPALLLALLAGCASLGPVGPGAAERDQLWRQAHAALAADSLRIAQAGFQRLATDHPRTMEGREARFFLATVYLDPRNPRWDAARAAEHLGTYLAADTAGAVLYRRPEAESLLRLAEELRIPCTDRTGPLRCEPEVVVRRDPVPGQPAPAAPADPAAASAENARLRRELAERDATIRQLREELQRIRETLAPRP